MKKLFLQLLVLTVCSVTITACTKKTDPYPPLREIGIKVNCDSCFYKLESDTYTDSNTVINHDSITVNTLYINKGQNWILTVNYTGKPDSSFIYVNGVYTVPIIQKSYLTTVYSFKVKY